MVDCKRYIDHYPGSLSWVLVMNSRRHTPLSRFKMAKNALTKVPITTEICISGHNIQVKGWGLSSIIVNQTSLGRSQLDGGYRGIFGKRSAADIGSLRNKGLGYMFLQGIQADED